jgi:hypothetical protein
VGCMVCGGCGGLGVHSTARGRAVGLGLKVRNRATKARFWVHRCKRRLGVVGRGGGLWSMQWLQ